jgi:hypothetical protein
MEDAEKIRHNGMHRCAFEYRSLVDLIFRSIVCEKRASNRRSA